MFAGRGAYFCPCKHSPSRSLATQALMQLMGANQFEVFPNHRTLDDGTSIVSLHLGHIMANIGTLMIQKIEGVLEATSTKPY